MSDSGSGTIDAGGAKKGRFRRAGLSIQSKLLIMLLGVSLVSSVIVGAIGFVNGRQSLHDSAVDQLITIRSMRAAEITTAIESVRRDASLNSRNLSAQSMSTAVNAGFADLADVELEESQRDAIEAYYADVFIPELEGRSGEEYGDTAFIPASAAGQYV